MPRYFNKKTATKVESDNGATMYRLKSGRYVLSDDKTGDIQEVDYLYFREWINRLPTPKLNRVLDTTDYGTINLNVRIPIDLKNRLWGLAEFEGVPLQRYLLQILEAHIIEAPQVGVVKLKARRREDGNN